MEPSRSDGRAKTHETCGRRSYLAALGVAAAGALAGCSVSLDLGLSFDVTPLYS